ncbi:hypothetical protein N7539_007505 [Penicillium diatomitis]|uniref:Restriction of telomere capping protein 4 n=1 Tax=Penicillium diatomitis TaxID=2819901 RepID=A0A9W9WW52_9EURO|nr:uncharacterized protein N7539_007505 [Penicillium diatomitis]KAJ5477361.1 hypothetical protein N7539_007505 [Penicillium diatomitis]
MQAPHRKLDSSYRAAAGLTRRVNLGRHLLSTYNKPKENEPVVKTETTKTVTQELSLSSDGEELSELSSADMPSEPEFDLPATRKIKTTAQYAASPESSPSHHEENQLRVTQEPAIDDEPISTEEEASDQDSDFQSSKKRPALESYEEKKRTGKGRNPRKESDDESPIFSSWSSQRSKRAKPNTYGSVNIRVPKYVKRPSLSPESGSSGTEASTSKIAQKRTDKQSGISSNGGMLASKKVKSPSSGLAGSSPASKKSTTVPIDTNPYSSHAASSFKEPLSIDLDEDESGFSSLTSPPSSVASEPDEPRQALCPMCKKEVDPQLLELFLAQPKQRVREQERFCASHQQGTVEKEWEANGLPTISWDSFDQRLQKHFPSLEKLLVPDCTSYYRNILEEALKTGKAQNFRLTLSGDGLETISCGYYGTKGSGKM